MHCQIWTAIIFIGKNNIIIFIKLKLEKYNLIKFTLFYLAESM